jgi:hypothetical protein
MGWDITYHPFAQRDVVDVYFKGIEDPNHWKAVSDRFGLDPANAEELRECLSQAASIPREMPFNKGHAYMMAMVAGYLRKYWYVRGGVFSFLIGRSPTFVRYTQDWTTLVPSAYVADEFRTGINQNFCGGVFLSPEGLQRLKDDYRSDATVASALDEQFSHGRLPIFWKAVDFALEHNLGLIEAAEVVAPNPFDLNTTKCASNLMNCDIEGALLYAKTAHEQLLERGIGQAT